MKGVLALHDASSYVHTAEHGEHYRKVSTMGFPLGGVGYLLKTLVLNLCNGNEVAVMFDSRTDRKSIMPGYKSGREFKPRVSIQLDFLYERLQMCGIPVYKVDGYEADDLLHSAVEYNRPHYKKINVYSGDYDLAHTVDMKVSLEPVNKNTNKINFTNFRYGVRSGEDVMFNTIAAHKVLCGDHSDKVPAFLSENAIKGQVLYDFYCKFLNSNIPPGADYAAITRSQDNLVKFINNCKASNVLTDRDVHELGQRIKVIWLRDYRGIEYTAVSENKINLDVLARLLSYCHDTQSLQAIGRKWMKVLPDDEEYFKKRARELVSGEYSADRGQQLRVDAPTVTTRTLREF